MYVKHNINPKNKKTGDCAIRAVGAATKLGWDLAYEGLCRHGFMLKTAPNDTEAIHSFLIEQGFKEGIIRVTKGSKRPTVDSFAKEHPKWYSVLRVSNHITCCAYGNYLDIWDCGKSAVYKYWYKEIN